MGLVFKLFASFFQETLHYFLIFELGIIKSDQNSICMHEWNFEKSLKILWHRKNSVTIQPITIRSCYSYITLSMTCPIKGLSLMRTSTLDDCLIVSNSCLRITIDYDLGPEKSIEFWFYWAARNLKEREQEGELAYSGGDLHKLNEIQKLQYYTYIYSTRWFKMVWWHFKELLLIWFHFSPISFIIEKCIDFDI